jgi:hypothetical protein
MLSGWGLFFSDVIDFRLETVIIPRSFFTRLKISDVIIFG